MMRKKLITFFASGAYAGYSPLASGTVGTGVGILVFLAFSRFNPAAYVGALTIFTLVSFWIAHEAEKIFQEKDSGKIVIDEIVGYLFTMLWIPISAADLWFKVLLGFFLFRFTDVIKFFPARYIDRRWKHGVGVVMDDVVAGIYANLLLRGLLLMWTRWG